MADPKYFRPGVEAELMVLPATKRREYFTKQYMIELGRLHAAGKCAWPIERLGEMAEKMVAGLADGSADIGEAAKAACAAFGLKPSYSRLRAFLESDGTKTEEA